MWSLPPSNLRVRPRRDHYFPKCVGLEGSSHQRTSARRIPPTVSSSASQPAAALALRAIDIIAKKRDAHELSATEIEYFIQQYTRGEIPDYQASAWLMAA